MIKAILFDVDGVLVDSRDANAVFFQRLLQKYGYKKPSKKEYYKLYSTTMLDTIRTLTKEKSEKKIMEVWKAGHNFKYPNNLIKVDKDTESVICILSEEYKLGIVTSRFRDSIEWVFRKLDIKEYFDTIIAFEDYTKPKPDPEPLLVAAKRLGVLANECIYIGDADVDFIAAKAARMNFVRYSKAGFSGVTTVNSFKEIPPAIEKISLDIV